MTQAVAALAGSTAAERGWELVAAAVEGGVVSAHFDGCRIYVG